MDARFSFPIDALKIFRTAGRGPRNRVDEREGRDGRFTHRIASRDPLFQQLPTLTPAECAGTIGGNTKLKLWITPDYFNRINPADEYGDICRPMAPRLAETHAASGKIGEAHRGVIQNFERPAFEFIPGPVRSHRLKNSFHRS